MGRRDAKLMPSEDPNSDRVENQLMFVPTNYDQIRNSTKRKLMVFYNGIESWWYIDIKKKEFLDPYMKCPVTTCTISNKREDAEKADFVIFSGQHSAINLTRTPNQIYAFYRLESPVHWNASFTSMFEFESFSSQKISVFYLEFI